jgi:predicted Zn-dependent protease
MKLSPAIASVMAFAVLAVMPSFAQDAEKVAALGASMAAEFQQHSSAIASPDVQDYVDRLGRELAARLPASPFPFHFTVIAEDPCPPLHEVYALPGGYFFVPAALFSAARDEAEFAGMLAHSMAYVIELPAGQRTGRERLPAAGASRVFTPACSVPVAVPAGFLKIQRQAELREDRIAVQTLARTGFDPNALARYIERVQPPALAVPAAFSPLPSKDERMANLQAEIAKLPPAANAALTTAAFEAAREAVRRLAPVERSNPPSLRRVPQ